MEFGTLAHHWNGSFERVRGYIVSRKFNGHSILWDGGLTLGWKATKVPWYYKGADKDNVVATGLWSLGRGNKPKVIKAPPEFLSKLPIGIPTHGELWFKDNLSMVKQIAGRKDNMHPLWEDIKYIVFNIKPYECWNYNGSDILGQEIKKWSSSSNSQKQRVNSFYQNNNYFDRMKLAVEYIYPDLNIVEEEEDPMSSSHQLLFLDLKSILTKEDLDRSMQTARNQLWEGLMFQDPNRPYENKRSWGTLKYKTDYETEATIIGYKEGKTNSRIGTLGSIRCELTWDNKVSSMVGGSDRFVGKTVSFRVSGLNESEYDWDKKETNFPLGGKLRFKFSNISSLGVPQSCNIYRGL